MAVRLSYLDTSAIVKRYVSERGTTWIDRCLRHDVVALSHLTVVELASALERRTRDGSLTRAAHGQLLSQFRTETAGFVLVPLTRAVLDDAASLVTGLPTALPVRTLDLIHLACARLAFHRALSAGGNAGDFVSADTRLLAAGSALGFSVVNPETQP